MRILFAFLFLFCCSAVFAQHRIAIFDVEGSKNGYASLQNVSSYIVASYSSDDRFTVIDKANMQLIRNEQDRQKSEEFIDGYIVKQGVQEGFDYCYYPKYIKRDKKLLVKVYDVAKGTVISSQSVDMKNNILGMPKNMEATINKLIDKINTDCFQLRYEVLRCIDKKKKAEAKELLFAIGYNQMAKQDAEFDIYILVKEKVGGKVLERKEVIGEAKIKEIQDSNFSTLRVGKGGKAIMDALNAGQQLYGSISK